MGTIDNNMKKIIIKKAVIKNIKRSKRIEVKGWTFRQGDQKVTYELRLYKVMGSDMKVFMERVIQADRKTNAKALRQWSACLVQGIARKPVWLQGSDQWEEWWKMLPEKYIEAIYYNCGAQRKNFGFYSVYDR